MIHNLVPGLRGRFNESGYFRGKCRVRAILKSDKVKTERDCFLKKKNGINFNFI